MNGYQYNLAKQTEWAKNHSLDMIGRKVTHGRHAYTIDLDQNLFQPLLPDMQDAFAAGDGGEIGSPGLPGKMQAIHSSSALAVNIFQYWKSIGQISLIAAACGLCKQGSETSCDLQFEEKYPIDDSFGLHPNVDVVIHNKRDAKIQRFAIECKFSEAYGSYKHAGLKAKYLDVADRWDDIPHLRVFSERISPDDKEFKHLHPAQLIKHILGMKRKFGLGGFRLLYLWYDVLGEQGKRHHDEVAHFGQVARADGLMFHSLTFQELIARMADRFRTDHSEYVRYLTERYL